MRIFCFRPIGRVNWSCHFGAQERRTFEPPSNHMYLFQVLHHLYFTSIILVIHASYMTLNFLVVRGEKCGFDMTISIISVLSIVFNSETPFTTVQPSVQAVITN